MINSALSKMISSMVYLSALTMMNEEIYNTKKVFRKPPPIVLAEEWKRKLCKSCKSCGSVLSGQSHIIKSLFVLN